MNIRIDYWTPLIFLMVGYAILNRGFAYIGYYPIFIGEICILFYMLALNHRKLLSLLISSTAGKLFLSLLIYNLFRFGIAAINDFPEALRNSVYWVYTIYFYFGFAFGCSLVRNNNERRFERILLLISILTVIYYAVYPLRSALLTSTSFLYGGTSLVGYHSTLHALSIGMIPIPIYLGLKHGKLVLALGVILIIGISQSRGAILALMSAMAYVCLFERRASLINSGLAVSVSLLGLLLAMEMSGFQIEILGQRGTFSADFLLDMFSSIFTASGNSSLDGTKEDRLHWWIDVISRTSNTSWTLIWGLGVDTLLVDRETRPGFIIRYPHNSFVSIFGFSGIVGFTLYFGLVVAVFGKIFRQRRLRGRSRLIAWYPLFVVSFLTSAFFSTVLEAPFHSAVFWLISGVIFAFAHKLHGPNQTKPGALRQGTHSFINNN